MTSNGEFTFSIELILYILTLPVAWIPKVHTLILHFLWDFSTPVEASVKGVIFLLPCLHLIIAMWATMLGLYTVPFRSGRGAFIVSLISTWWDTGRSIVLYWLGFVQAAFLTLGWIWGFIRIVTGGLYLAIVEVLMLPLSLVKRATQSTLHPGIPWIAIGLTFLWISLEAGLFSYTIYPMVSEIALDLVGTSGGMFLQPALFFILFMLIAGSFACMQVMVDAVHEQNYKDLAQMVIVEVFVMFFEVVFLYRELVDAVTPALAQQSGGQLRIGIFGVLAISAMCWMGIRGMTWFLFGRFGTPTLLSIISGRGITDAPPASQDKEAEIFAWTKAMISHVKAEIGWFRTTGKELLEAYILPPLQLVAATINFFTVFVTGRHLFRLPLKSLHAFMETGELLKLAKMPEGPSHGGGHH